MLEIAAICDARSQDELLAQANQSRKLRTAPALPGRARHNTPQALEQALAPFRRDGSLPDYPLGSDFTGIAQRLLPALGWLKRATSSTGGKLATVGRALLTQHASDANESACLHRMALDAPSNLGDRLQARLLRHALRQTAAS